jgi:hypothetical protein
VDEDFLRVAADVPEFGGMYFDENQRLTVLLTDVTQRSRAEAAIRPFFGRRAATATANFVVRPARFGFMELRRWRTSANARVLQDDEVVFTDIDEPNNRILVAVESPAARGRVTAALHAAGIPADAFVVEERSPIGFAQSGRDRASENTLQMRQLHPLAGVQIANSSNALCTHGPAAVKYPETDGFSYFLTNSHCTNVQGGVENTPFYQPVVNSSYLIGVEVSDPEYFEGGNCPAGRRCRFSDAALIRYQQSQWETFGTIARPVWAGQFTGSIHFYEHFTIYAFYSPYNYLTAPLVGQNLSKVGRTTGWTVGPVANTCVDVNVDSSDVTLFCQVVVNAGGGFGDSGSPVFANGGSIADLYGMLWGVGANVFAFSTLPSIHSELGTLYYCSC